MPVYRTACFGLAPGCVLDAAIEALTPALAAERSLARHLPARRIVSPVAVATVNGMHYFATVATVASAEDTELIVTAKETAPPAKF